MASFKCLRKRDVRCCACRWVLVAEARRCIYGHQLEGYKQVRYRVKGDRLAPF